MTLSTRAAVALGLVAAALAVLPVEILSLHAVLLLKEEYAVVHLQGLRELRRAEEARDLLAHGQAQEISYLVTRDSFFQKRHSEALDALIALLEEAEGHDWEKASQEARDYRRMSTAFLADQTLGAEDYPPQAKLPGIRALIIRLLEGEGGKEKSAAWEVNLAMSVVATALISPDQENQAAMERLYAGAALFDQTMEAIIHETHRTLEEARAQMVVEAGKALRNIVLLLGASLLALVVLLVVVPRRAARPLKELRSFVDSIDVRGVDGLEVPSCKAEVAMAYASLTNLLSDLQEQRRAWRLRLDMDQLLLKAALAKAGRPMAIVEEERVVADNAAFADRFGETSLEGKTVAEVLDHEGTAEQFAKEAFDDLPAKARDVRLIRVSTPILDGYIMLLEEREP